MTTTMILMNKIKVKSTGVICFVGKWINRMNSCELHNSTNSLKLENYKQL